MVMVKEIETEADPEGVGEAVLDGVTPADMVLVPDAVIVPEVDTVML